MHGYTLVHLLILPNKTMSRIDYDKLRQIPILDVAQTLGVDIVRSGVDVHSMREDGEITSLVLFERTNSFHRFSGKEQGGVSGGSVIDLVMHINECSLELAVEFLTSHFPQYL